MFLTFLSTLFVSVAQDSNNSPPPAPRRASVVLIVADDLSLEDLGCYGSKKIKTPNLDQMAAEGARFTSFYAGSTADLPSRAALMLGLHTGHLKTRDDSPGATLRSDDLTFSQLMQQSGYRTGLMGKWGLTDGVSGLPQDKGFEQFGGFLNNSEAESDYAEFIQRYESGSIGGTRDARVQIAGNEAGKKGQYVSDVLTKATLNFIRISKPAEFNKYRPFFLMLAYPLPRANDSTAQVPGTGAYSSEQWSQTEKNKAAMISRLDAYVGQILEKLKSLKIESNTIVIFMGNNSPQGQDAARTSLNENDLRVPFIIRWPGRLKPATIAEPWAAWDIFPTMTEIARMDCPTNIDGISFYPMLRGRTQTNRHDFLYWEIHDPKRGSQQAARMGDWKAVRKVADGPLELYDLKSDPGEKKNVADKHSDVIAKFGKFLKTARNEDQLWPLKKPVEEPSPKGDKS